MSFCSRIIFAFTIAALTSICFALNAKPTFESSEHIATGETVSLYFDANDKGQTLYEFHLPSGLTLTYADIFPLADFYETPNQPISKGKTLAEQQARFMAAFNSFARNQANVNEANRILAVLHRERQIIKNAIEHGANPEIIYRALSNETSRQINCITGGGCTSKWWLSPGRYLTLAKTDYDHFGHNAWTTYKVGHELALNEAIAARADHDIKRLEMAYAMNAFACHFLSDRYSSGHIRTPRVKLPYQVTPQLIGSLLAHFMHNEENVAGVHVHNNRGNRWIAYGDKAYFTRKNEDNRIYLSEALQASANQIFAAYQTGRLDDEDYLQDLVPQPDESGNVTFQDISPLFYWDTKSNKMMRRSDINNLYDRHFVDNWWAWSTLILLSNRYGLDGSSQAALAASNLAKKALADGLITDKQVIAHLKSGVE